jgi:hypothetical protein
MLALRDERCDRFEVHPYSRCKQVVVPDSGDDDEFFVI